MWDGCELIHQKRVYSKLKRNIIETLLILLRLILQFLISEDRILKPFLA
jgi:hypothetical protein